MARGTITAEMSGLDDIIAALEALPEQIEEAKRAGSKAMMEQGEEDLKKSWLQQGGKVNDYIYKSIGHYGRTLPSDATGYWTSVGVFTMDGPRAEYAAKKGKAPEKVLTAAQIAYWIENGTSRLRSGLRKPRGVDDTQLDPATLASVAPKPFISNAFFTGWKDQQEAFAKAFNKKIEELKS